MRRSYGGGEEVCADLEQVMVKEDSIKHDKEAVNMPTGIVPINYRREAVKYEDGWRNIRWACAIQETGLVVVHAESVCGMASRV